MLLPLEHVAYDGAGSCFLAASAGPAAQSARLSEPLTQPEGSTVRSCGVAIVFLGGYPVFGCGEVTSKSYAALPATTSSVLSVVTTPGSALVPTTRFSHCLLYTSDAADE